VMGAAPRRPPAKWRRTKSRRRLQKTARSPGQETAGGGAQPSNGDQPDRLLLSALKYWEVKRDLIDERLAAMRSATAAS
jgi:hypothetical protein